MKKIIVLSSLTFVFLSGSAYAAFTQPFKVTGLQVSATHLSLFADRSLTGAVCGSDRWISIPISAPTAKSIQANALTAQVNGNLIAVNLDGACISTFNSFNLIRNFQATE